VHALPTFTYMAPDGAGSSSAEGKRASEIITECSVCLGEFAPGEVVKRLPCDHFFHQECIDRWLVHTVDNNAHALPSCPLCKRVPITGPMGLPNAGETAELEARIQTRESTLRQHDPPPPPSPRSQAATGAQSSASNAGAVGGPLSRAELRAVAQNTSTATVVASLEAAAASLEMQELADASQQQVHLDGVRVEAVIEPSAEMAHEASQDEAREQGTVVSARVVDTRTHEA